MSEIKSPDEKGDFTKARGDFDYKALADAFEAQGNVVEAKRFRDLAKKQPGIEEQGRAALSANLDKTQRQREKEPIPQQPEIHPEFNARSNKGLQEQVEKMLQVNNNNQAPK